MSKAEDKGKRGEGDGKRIEADQLRPGRIFRNCPDCPEMVVVPAGEFIMGSNENDGEKPPHKVSIQRPFAASKYEVTFGEWDECVAGGGCASNPRPSEAGWGEEPAGNQRILGGCHGVRCLGVPQSWHDLPAP